LLMAQTPYNSNGKINVIPIIVYHNITTSLRDYSIRSHATSTTLDIRSGNEISTW